MSPLASHDHVVVVGAGLSGFRFVEGLRREGYEGKISLVGGESHLPYDRPPLSKQVLSGTWEPARAALTDLEQLAKLDVAVTLGHTAESLDVEENAVTLSDGSTVTGTFVVIATGMRARRLNLTASSQLHVVRSVDDAATLHRTLSDSTHQGPVAVIGGGFIGAEVATSARALDREVIVLEALERPLVTVLGATVAQWLAELPDAFGVELRSSQRITDVTGSDGQFTVHLDGADDVAASVVVEGVGAVPNTQWLESSGLDVSNGVLVDERLRASERIAAIGDVARFAWRHGPFEETVRIEHWQVANDHAHFLARSLVGSTSEPLSIVPYFWSDQYGKKIQVLGYPNATDLVHLVAGSPGEGRFLALYEREGCVSAMVALSMPRALMVSRATVELHAPVAEALAAAPWRA